MCWRSVCAWRDPKHRLDQDVCVFFFPNTDGKILFCCISTDCSTENDISESTGSNSFILRQKNNKKSLSI